MLFLGGRPGEFDLFGFILSAPSSSVFKGSNTRPRPCAFVYWITSVPLVPSEKTESPHQEYDHDDNQPDGQGAKKE